MDAQIIELLPYTFGLKNGDTKLIKGAGAVVSHPWGSVIRSLLVTVFELRVKEIMVIAYHDCGVWRLHVESFLNKVHDGDIPDSRIETLQHADINPDGWLINFDNVEDSVRHTVGLIRGRPLMPTGVAVHNLVIYPITGKLSMVVNGTLA